MHQIPLMSAVMTPFPHFVEIGERLDRAAEHMRELDIRHLPVKESGSLVGVLSDRDVRVAMAAAADLPGGSGLQVRSACRLDVPLVDVHERLDSVLAKMVDGHLDCVLVVKERRLAGIFTTSDACESFARLLRSLFPDGGDHAA